MYEYYITPNEYEEAKKNGIGRYTLEKRIRELAWDKEKAIKEPVKKYPDRSKWIKIAEENGISYQLFINRINDLGWDLEKASTTLVTKKGYTYRKYSDEILEQADKTIGRKNFYNRIRKGWTIERALTEPLYSKEDKLKKMKENSNKEVFNKLNSLLFKKC